MRRFFLLLAALHVWRGDGEHVQQVGLSDAAADPAKFALRGGAGSGSAGSPTWNVAAALGAHKKHKRKVNAAAAARGGGDGGVGGGGGGGGGMKLYSYAPHFEAGGVESYWTKAVLDAAKRSKRATTDAAAAEVFMLGTEYACQLDWPSYTNDPPDANYLLGDKQMCPKQRDARLKAYMADKSLATHLDCSSTKFAGKTHVVFDMMGYTLVPDWVRACKQQIVFAAPSFDYMYHRRNVDLSWPAPNLISMDSPRVDIRCDAKPKYRVVFKGTLDATVRRTLRTLHDPSAGVIVKLTQSKDNCHSAADVKKHMHPSKHHDVTSLHTCGSGEYKELLQNTAFGLVLRGDNLYSYRFLEVLSAGAIPVIFSDRWVLPFYEAVDYKKFAIVLKESQAPQLLSILAKYSDADICRMRQEAKRVYRASFSSFDAKLETAMEVFERRKAGNTLPPPLDWAEECRKCDCC